MQRFRLAHQLQYLWASVGQNKFKESQMKNNLMRKVSTLFAIAFLAFLSVNAGEKAPATTTPVQKTVTVHVLGADKPS
jgi:hypothetical protein